MSDQQPGPWGNSGNSQGTRPSGSAGQADFDDMIRKSQERFRSAFGGGGGNGSGNRDGGDVPDSRKTVMIGLLAILVLWLASGIYRVGADEQGVVLRFGKYIDSTGPGLHYHLPYPIEMVYTPSVTTINKVEVRGDGRGGQRDDNRMLAGDLNLVDINFDVQWKINPLLTADFLFNVRDPIETIRPVAESVMREVIGQMKLETIIDKGQAEIAERSATTIQEVLDGYKAGITIVGVNLRKPDVPDEVIDSYQDVKKAEQDLETEVSKANRYRNQIIPTAKGKAEQMVQQALAYKQETISEAQGQADRFIQVYNEYKLAKNVTRQRLYLETMEKILAGMPKVILDGKASGGVLPYLPLPEIQNKRLTTGEK